MASSVSTTELKVIATTNTEAFNKLTTVLERLDKNILATAKGMQQTTAASNSYATSQEKVAAAAQKSAVAVKALDAPYAKLRRELKAAGDDVTKQTAAYQRLQTTLRALGMPTNQVKTMMAQLNQQYKTGSQSANQFAASQAKVTGSTHEARGSLDKFGQSMRQTIVHVTSALIVYRGIVETFSATVFAASHFDESMRNVNTIAQLSEQQFDKLSDTVLNAAGSFEYGGAGAVELANGLYGIQSSAFEGADALNILSVSSRAAAAGVTETATASAVILGVLNAYGMAASEAEHVSDVLFNTVNFGIITFEELASTLGVVNSTASQLGVGIEETGAAIITMTRNGIPAHETMTSINQVLVSLLDPAEAAKKKFDELGIEWGKSAFEGKDFIEVMADIEAKTAGNAQAQAELFGNVRALRGVFSLLADEGVEFALMQEELANSAGAMTRAYEQTSRSLGFQFRATFANIQAELIGSLGPALVQILQMFEKMAPRLIEIAQTVLESFVEMGPTIEAGLGFIAGAVKLISDSLGSLPGAWQLGIAAALLFGNQIVGMATKVIKTMDMMWLALKGGPLTGPTIGAGGIIAGISAAIFGLDILVDQLTGEGILSRIFGGGNETAVVLDSTLKSITGELALMKARAEELDPALENALTLEAFTSGDSISGLIGMIDQWKSLADEMERIRQASLETAGSFTGQNLGRFGIIEGLKGADVDRVERYIKLLERMFQVEIDRGSPLDEQVWSVLAKEMESTANGFAELVNQMELTPEGKLEMLADFLGNLKGEARETAIAALGDDIANFISQMGDVELPMWLETLLFGGVPTGPEIAAAGIESFANLARSAGEAAAAIPEITEEAEDMAAKVEVAIKRADDAFNNLFSSEQALLNLQKFPLEMDKIALLAEQRVGQATVEDFDATERGKEIIQMLQDIDLELANIDDKGQVFSLIKGQIDDLITAGKGGLGVFGDIATELDGIDEALQFAFAQEGLTDLTSLFPNFMNESIWSTILAFKPEDRGTLLKSLGDIATEIEATSITFDPLKNAFNFTGADGTTITVDVETLLDQESMNNLVSELDKIPPETIMSFVVGGTWASDLEVLKSIVAGIANAQYTVRFTAAWDAAMSSSYVPPPAPTYDPPPGLPSFAGPASSGPANLSGLTEMTRMIDKGAAETLQALRSTIPTQQAIIGTIDELAEMSVKVVETFARWASFISEEGLESAENFANTSSTIYGMVQEAFEASEFLATQKLIRPAESQIHTLAELSAKFVEIFGAWASFFVTIGEEGENINPLMENATQFAQTASAVIGPVQEILDGMNALGAMGSLKPPNVDKINLFAEVIAKFIDAMGAVMTAAHTQENLEGIDAFANTGGGIIGLISDTIEGLKEIAGFQVPDPLKTWQVISTVKLIIDQTIVLLNELFDTLTDNDIDVYTQENMDSIGLFADGGGAIVDLIANTIEAFRGINRFKVPNPQDTWNVLRAVKETVDQAIVLLNELFDTDIDAYSQENMDSLSVFAGGAGSIISLITNTIDAFKGIAAFKSPDIGKVRELLQSVKQIVDLVVDFLFSDEGAAFSDAELEKASLWSQTASAIVDLIANGVDALSFKKLPTIDLAAVGSFIGQIHEILRQVIGLIDKNSPYSREDTSISNNMLEKAALWAQTASDIVNIIGDGVEAFKTIKKFTPPDEDILRDFIKWIHDLVKQVADAAKGMEGLDEASIFATTAGTIIDSMLNVQEAVDNVRKFRTPNASIIDDFIGFIKDLVKRFGEAARSPELDGLLGAAGNLAEKVQMVMDAVNVSFEAFENINNFDGLNSMDAFFEAILQVIIRAGEKLGDIPQALLDEAEDASDAIEQAIGEFAGAVESINSINRLRRPSAEAFTNFVESISDFIDALGSTKFEKDVVQAARKFNRVIGKAMSNISSAVEALTSLDTLKMPSDAVIDNFVAAISSFIDRFVQGLRTSLINSMTEAEIAALDVANSIMSLISSAASAISSAAEAAILNVDMDAFMGKIIGAINDVAGHINDAVDVDTAIKVLENLAPFFEELQKLGLVSSNVAEGGAAGGGGGRGGAPAGRGEESAPRESEAEKRAKERIDKFMTNLRDSFGNVEIPLDSLLNSLDKLPDSIRYSTDGVDLFKTRLDALNSAITEAEAELADLFSQTFETQMAEAGQSIIEALLAQMRLNQDGDFIGELGEDIDSLVDALRSLFDMTKETAQLDRAGNILQGFLKAAMEPFSTSGTGGGFDISTQNFMLTQGGLQNVFGSLGDDMAKFVNRILRQNGIIGANESVIGQDTLTLQGWLSELEAALQVSQAIDAALDAFAEGMTAEEKARSRLIERWDRLYAEWETVGEIAGQVQDGLEGLDPNTQLTQQIFSQAFGALAADAIAVLESALAAAGMEGVDLFSLTAGELTAILEELGQFGSDQSAIDDALAKLVEISEGEASSREAQIAKIQELKDDIARFETEKIDVLRLIAEYTAKAAEQLEIANSGGDGGAGGGDPRPPAVPDFDAMSLETLARNVGNQDVDNLANAELKGEVLERFQEIKALMNAERGIGGFIYQLTSNGMSMLGAVQEWWANEGFPQNLLDDFVDYANIPGAAKGGTFFPKPGGHIIRIAEAGRPETVVPWGAGGNPFGGSVEVYAPITVSGVSDPHAAAELVKRGLVEVLDEAKSDLRAMVHR